MAPITLRVLSSTLLVGAVLHCSASEPGEPTVEPESIINIPEKGLAADEQKSVWLKPSNSLRVVDSSNAAVFLPQPGQEPSAEPSPEQMSAVAYVFENGVCDFEKTVEYKKLFPGHEKPLWVRTAPAAAAGAEEASPAPAANYTFTNPSAEVLGGEGASFCVRFRVQRPLQPQPPIPENDDGPTGDKGEPGEGDPLPEALPERPPALPPPVPGDAVVPGIGVGARDMKVDPAQEQKEPLKQAAGLSPESAKHEVVKPVEDNSPNEPLPRMETSGNFDNTVQVGRLAAAPSLPDSSTLQPTEDHEVVESVAGSQASVQSGHDSKKPDLQVKLDKLNSGLTGGKQARLRRLSEPTESQDKYLTIVVHSTAWRAAGSVAAASAALLTVAAWLLLMF
ncbi:Toxoplasma gondii family A protein [Besnoitia besnoiti]|uniref:Toxoplasma gondii family A protein n=1 Tax=Besnoitia besnoiti TaxID=94643 RepID=A0A2A9MME2_BESBE|nr:Toxoplasma gondii family A protein [Besnoitia besnoiti]PFH36730.1 Toxoplasma gondii family A protein [Besnoitia besnoiti]